MTTLRTISPVDGAVCVERTLAGPEDIEQALTRAAKAQKLWRETPLERRRERLTKAVDAFLSKGDEIARELSLQMGRPIAQAPGELAGFEERARHMLAIAPQALADVVPEAKDGFTRFVRRVPLGVVVVIAPWNYPYLTSVNAVIPALMAGNAVILKHSHQTPLCAERYDEAFKAAGLPEGVFQYLHLSHDDTEALIGDARVAGVNFTGSVPGGAAVEKAIAGRFISSGLELGGKDPAYVRPDADLTHTVEGLVDGAFFNSGQSCCGIERIYVHEGVYDSFVERFVALTRTYRLGNPLDPNTNLGPMVRSSSAQFVRGQIAEAVAQGAKALIDPSSFPENREDGPYLAPQVLVNVDHTMRVMREESFGPVVGIMKVRDDEEALSLMNDSDFGLTASLWTADEEAALALAGRLETGTVYMNRCDYLDPALAWTGVKKSGRGCTLSPVGYETLTRPMSFNFRTET